MSSTILDLVKLNETVDYSIVIPLAILYVLVFWLIVSGWVGYDANKRFHSKWKAALLFILNLIFGLPFTILYMLTKPMVDEESYSEDRENGTMNIPVVNFIGKDGAVMALELKINSSKLTNETTPEMKVDVSFNPEAKENLQLVVETTDAKVQPIEEVQPEIENLQPVVLDQVKIEDIVVEKKANEKEARSLSGLLKKIRTIITKRSPKIQPALETTVKVAEEKDVDTTKTIEAKPNSKKKTKKKKRRR